LAALRKGPSFALVDGRLHLTPRACRDHYEAIDPYYFGAAHTGGDALIVFRGLAVMHAGAVFLGPTSPSIDADNGGSGVAYPQTLADAAAGRAALDVSTERPRQRRASSTPGDWDDAALSRSTRRVVIRARCSARLVMIWYLPSSP